MFPFFEPNLFPLLEGGGSFFISSYEKERRSCGLLPSAAGAFSRLVALVSLPPFYAICGFAIGVPLAAA